MKKIAVRVVVGIPIVIGILMTMISCSSQPVPVAQESPTAASPDPRTVKAAEPSAAEAAHKREVEEEERRVVETNLAIVEGKTPAVPEWTSALQYPSKWKGTCEAYAKAEAAGYLAREGAAERLGRNPKDIENLVRIARINAARALYESMKEFAKEHCGGGERPLSLDDPLGVSREIGWLLRDAKATNEEAGFSTTDIRNRVVAGAKKEMVKLREDLKLTPVGEEVIPGTDELARDRKSAAEARVNEFLSSGITAEELGITAAEAKRIQEERKGS